MVQIRLPINPRSMGWVWSGLTRQIPPGKTGLGGGQVTGFVVKGA